MKLTIVGCSGSLPGPDSAASCYLVEVPDEHGRTWRVLLDLGSGALGPLQRYCDPRSVDAVLLSHLHPDHCLDLTAMYVLLRYHPLPGPAGGVRLPVWGPAGVAARIAAAHDPIPADGGTGSPRTERPDLGDHLDFHEWTAGEAVDIGPLHVQPVAVHHPVEAYGVRLSWQRKPGTAPVVLGYSGDTDDCPGLDVIAADADLFLCEAAFVAGEQADGVHLTGQEAGDVAERAGARALLLTHVPPWHDPGRAAAAAAEVYRGPVHLATAGMVLDLR